MRPLLLVAGMVLLSAAPAGAETFICKQPDGSETMTNAPTGGICKPYISEGTMNEVPDRELQRQRMLKPEERAREIEEAPAKLKKAQEVLRDLEEGGDGTGSRARSGSSTTVPRSAPIPPGQISFEQFRMLNRGMTDGQVLAKIGSPMSRSVLSCVVQTRTLVCPERWTYGMEDGWVASLVFIAGQLSEFSNARP